MFVDSSRNYKKRKYLTEEVDFVGVLIVFICCRR